MAGSLAYSLYPRISSLTSYEYNPTYRQACKTLFSAQPHLTMLFNTILPTLIGLEHIYILTLETFFWQRPLGMRTFRNSPASAAATAPLAANMGLYNGFLAAALLGTTYAKGYREMGAQVWPLLCVVVAGAYGGVTVGRRIWWVQGMPAVVALVGLSLS